MKKKPIKITNLNTTWSKMEEGTIINSIVNYLGSVDIKSMRLRTDGIAEVSYLYAGMKQNIKLKYNMKGDIQPCC